MSGKSAEDYADDYTDPRLRERLKEEIKAGSRGGAPGQWSARKSQLLTTEYEKHGGGYRHPGELAASQRHLEEWTAQEWRTEDGEASARSRSGTRRYLPDAAWQLMTDDERLDTDRAKQAGPTQRVPNTEAAKEARKAAELLDLRAADAQRLVRSMRGESQLDRAERAERELGKNRTTVLRAIERQRRA